MKTAIRLFALAALLLATPAVAQWQTPNHSVPIGRGAGVTGFGSAVPATAGKPLVSAGASADPVFGAVANTGIAAGAANTYKGSLNGTSTTDIAFPSCTSVTQALRYAAGVGPNCGTVSVLTGYDMPINMGLFANASGGNLAIFLTQADGTAPTSGSPVLIPFRSTSAGTGTVTWNTTSSTLNVLIPSGATLGTTNSVPFRVWVFATYNSGTTELGVATCSTSTQIFPCSAWESSLKTTTTISAGSTSAGVLYATTGVTLDAVRIIGHCDFPAGLATAGTWTSVCSVLAPMGPGVKKPGDEVQTAYNSTGANTTTPNTYANSATPPGTAGGAVAVAAPAITPVSPINHLVINARTSIMSAVAADHTCFLYNGSAVLAVMIGSGANASNLGGPCDIALETSNVTAATTYSLYFTGAQITGINGTSGGTQWWGGAGNTTIRVVEIQG